MTKARLRTIAAVVLAVGMCASLWQSAEAVPTLQIYIENSTYNPTTDTWEFTGNDVRLWVLGAVGSYGTISSVHLSAAYSATESGTISLVPTTASPGFLPAPGDPSVPAAAPLISNPSSATSTGGPCGDNGTSGTIPCMGNGSPLPPHGEYGSGINWVSFDLGGFTLTDSPIGDYINDIPNPSDPSDFPTTGQINAYDVVLSGFSDGANIHFDAFNHIFVGNHKIKYRFAPFSHDALSGGGGSVPAPSTLLLMASALGVAGAWRRSRRT
jgi:hypothetical protein